MNISLFSCYMKASEKSTKYLIMECTPCLKTDFVFLAGVYFAGLNLPLERRVNESSPPGKETEKKKTSKGFLT